MPHKITDPNKFPIWRQFSAWTRSSVNHIFKEEPFKPKTYNNQRICPLGLALYIECGIWIGFPADVDVADAIFQRQYPYETLDKQAWYSETFGRMVGKYGDAYIQMVVKQARKFINYWEDNCAKVA